MSKIIVIARIGSKNSFTASYDIYREAEMAAEVFLQETGQSFQNYAERRLLNKHPSEVDLPYGWDFETTDDVRKGEVAILVFKIHCHPDTGISGASN